MSRSVRPKMRDSHAGRKTSTLSITADGSGTLGEWTGRDGVPPELHATLVLAEKCVIEASKEAGKSVRIELDFTNWAGGSAVRDLGHVRTALMSAAEQVGSWVELLTSRDANAGQVRARVVMEETDQQPRGSSAVGSDKGNRTTAKPDAIAQQVEGLLDGMTLQSFVAGVEHAREAGHLAQRMLAERLVPHFQRFVKEQPHATYEEKQRLALRVNELLGSVGLAVECPNTLRPGMLVADVGGRDGAASRFRLDTRDESGKRARSWGGRDLSGLRIIPDVSRREPLAELHARRRREQRPRGH
jgi:hypothetical protein